MSKTKKILISTFAVLVLIPLVLFGLFEVSKSRTFQFFGTIVPRVETGTKKIALTFDDGPAPRKTDEILRILSEENVRGTFFLTGAAIAENPGELEKIIRAGHEVGNHSYNHKRMAFSSPGVVASEIEKTDELLRQGGWSGPIHFRPPYCSKLFTLPYYLSSRNRLTITWDVEPETFVSGTDEIVRHTIEKTRDGSIILLHIMTDQRADSMAAVKPIIRALRERGFEFVTIAELLSAEKKIVSGDLTGAR